LWGKTSGSRMGDKIVSSKRQPSSEVKDLLSKSEIKRRKKNDAGINDAASAPANVSYGRSLGSYSPTNPGSKAAYAAIVGIVCKKGCLGTGVPRDVIAEVVEEVVTVLREFGDRGKVEIGRLLNGEFAAFLLFVMNKFLTLPPPFFPPLPPPPSESGTSLGISDMHFNRLLTLSKDLSDYTSYKDASSKTNGDEDSDANNMDEENGVAVVFDSSDSDSDNSDSDLSKVRDSDSDSDSNSSTSNNLNKVKSSSNNHNDSDSDDDAAAHTILNPNDIDAQFIQRGLSKFYTDHTQSQNLANSVLSLLALPDAREAENKLVVLLGFDKFEYCKTLLANKQVIQFCVRLKLANDNEQEKNSIEMEMVNDDNEGPKILKALKEKGGVETWTKDRMTDLKARARREAKALSSKNKVKSANGHSNDVDDELDNGFVENDDDESDVEMDSAAKAAPNLLDLDSLSFMEGARVMSNKQCVLPDKSFRAQQPGYEGK